MRTTTYGGGGYSGNRICAAPPWWLWLIVTAAVAQAQNTTDPAEVRVINALFRGWGIEESSVTNMGWNISGEPCSGAAVDSTDFDSAAYNPAIKCDCNFPNSTCHITRLKVYAMDVVGEIPEGLWNLTYLTNLNLAQNYLTGPLSPLIGNLTKMQWLSFGVNALSGEVPPELGLLTDLRALAISTNKFSGSLPPELGNLRRLQQLYIDSSGLSGEIPSTFANLTSLVSVWASDNEFTGRIPDFIGNWVQLETLRLEGNSFEGSIPNTFSRLASLQDLRISGGLFNGTLDFIRNLTSLRVLSLRNNRFSGSIPTNIGDYQSLTRLDLSFNKLTGQIPRQLFNMSQLNFLYLGNNSLTGTLPNVKSTDLITIDVSYNNLSGTLPSWVSQSNLQLNIVVNNFTLEGSGSNALRSGSNCLQRNFPCGRRSPRYTDFGINCGGPTITFNNLVLEKDDEVLGPATYFVTNERRWGVSNTGQRDNPAYETSSSRQFTNTIDSELFQTARISAGSLRYYGLELENGDYTVTLQFAESHIEDGLTWRSTGRRVFDIYIQGNLEFPDFDIKMEAEGRSFRPVRRQAVVRVSDNYLEVHLFWSGKGTCCVPDQGSFGPLISAISATLMSNNSISTNTTNPPSTRKNRTGLIVGILIPVIVVSLLPLLALYILRQRRKDTFDNYEEFLGIDTKPYTFGYGDLRDATNDFSPENKLGEGGFGPVYKGTLDDGRVIAVKQLSIVSNHGKSQFVAEIATTSAVQHKNLVKLYGCCIDGDRRLLVYEYHENKSLDKALFGRKLSLNWSTRYEICLGIARGLAYLHEESRIRIIHRDVKASNVLLDSDMNPKISDFGLAKLYGDKQTHMSTRVAGTFGYLAPEYAMRGHLTEKADVFGFGVVVLEIVSGRPNSDLTLEDEEIYLLEWAWNLHEDNRELELVDEELSEFDENEVKRFINVALLCTQTSPMQRPSMSRVVAILSGDMKANGDITRPEYLNGFNFNDFTTFQSATETSGSRDNIGASTSHSIVSPNDDDRPMLHNIIG